MTTCAQHQTFSSTTKNRIFEWGYMPFYYTTVNTAETDFSGNWYVGGNLHNPQTVFIIPPVVIKLSQSGEQLWTYPQGYFEWELGEVTKINQSLDGNVLVAGWCMLGCDYGPTGVFVHKVDNSTGQAIWKKIFVDKSWDGKVSDIMETKTGDIILLAQRRFYKASSMGDSLLTADFDLGYSNHFTSGLALDGQLLLGHKTGIIESGLDGNIIAEYNFDGPVREIVSKENEYLFVADKTVVRTDLEMNILESYDFSDLIGDDFQVAANEEKFIVTGNNHILQIDFIPALIADHPFDTPGNYEIADISEKDGVLFTAGKTTGAQSANAIIAKTYTLDGSAIEHSTDLALSGIRVENIEAIESTWTPDLYSFKWDTWVTIQNIGRDPLTKCNISSWMIHQRICDHWVYLIPVEGLNLLPGESGEVFLGQMEDYSFYLPGADSMTYPLKMYSMQPNDKIDRDPGNDMAELSFVIDLSVGIDEVNNSKINIYPNPANEFIVIENPKNENISWEILSIHSNKVLNGIAKGNKTVVNIVKLNRGIYLIKATSQNGSYYSEKLIVL